MLGRQCSLFLILFLVCTATYPPGTAPQIRARIHVGESSFYDRVRDTTFATRRRKIEPN